MSRFHCHIIRDLSSGYVTFTLSEEDAKTLYFSCLANKDRSSVFDKLSKVLNGLCLD